MFCGMSYLYILSQNFDNRVVKVRKKISQNACGITTNIRL